MDSLKFPGQLQVLLRPGKNLEYLDRFFLAADLDPVQMANQLILFQSVSGLTAEYYRNFIKFTQPLKPGRKVDRIADGRVGEPVP